MGEHLAPGVFVEEVPSGAKAIEGVSTTTTGFVGPTASGPDGGEPALVTGLAEFEATFGRLPEEAGHDHLWHAARAFFAAGGKQLYVQPVALGASPEAYAAGLRAFEAVEDIAIVAAPGATLGLEADPESFDRGMAVVALLVAHAERMRYRVALLDSGDGQTVPAVRALRAAVDSSHAALHYPWVLIADPLTGDKLALPPSGFVAGLYARNDEERGVFKAPANLPLPLAVGLERTLTGPELELLGGEGINCLRTLPGRGPVLWGARTASANPEWKYVNLRRYFAYLERSIDAGTRWAVFEPNGPKLWARVRQAVEGFLHGELRRGALVGDGPEEAYFVRCDESTMTQDDIGRGRLVCLVGVAVVRPAEFVVFRLGQWTADASSGSRG